MSDLFFQSLGMYINVLLVSDSYVELKATPRVLQLVLAVFSPQKAIINGKQESPLSSWQGQTEFNLIYKNLFLKFCHVRRSIGKFFLLTSVTSRPFRKLWQTNRPTDMGRQDHREVSLPIRSISYSRSYIHMYIVHMLNFWNSIWLKYNVNNG